MPMTQAEFNEMFKKAWETLGVTRDDRSGGSQDLIAWATPARMVQTLWNEINEPEPAPSAGLKRGDTVTLA